MPMHSFLSLKLVTLILCLLPSAWLCCLFLDHIPLHFSGEVLMMSLVQKLWCLMHWKRLRKNWRNLSWGMTRKECLFLWLSLTKSIKSTILTSYTFSLFWPHSKRLSGLHTHTHTQDCHQEQNVLSENRSPHAPLLDEGHVHHPSISVFVEDTLQMWTLWRTIVW